MVKYPAVQARARTELDAVLESCRLPEFSDLEHLPFIQAVMLETLRWVPTIPMGVAHATSADDEYRGYFIPKGTLVMHNTWYDSQVCATLSSVAH
jgi:cytochrome P450